MPLYEYYCPVCSEHFQVQMSIAQYGKSATAKCPKCGSAEPRRILSPPNIGSSSRNRGGDGGGCCSGGCCG